MEALVLASLYDKRWFFLNLTNYDIHQDITFSNLFYTIAYIQVQMIGAFFMFTTESYREILLPETAKENEYGQVASDSVNRIFWIKESTLIVYLHILKGILCFSMGIKCKYIEQTWFRKVFFQKDGSQAAVFTEPQQHRISSYEIRKTIFFGDTFSAPFSKMGHFLFWISIL